MVLLLPVSSGCHLGSFLMTVLPGVDNTSYQVLLLLKTYDWKAPWVCAWVWEGKPAVYLRIKCVGLKLVKSSDWGPQWYHSTSTVLLG